MDTTLLTTCPEQKSHSNAGNYTQSIWTIIRLPDAAHSGGPRCSEGIHWVLNETSCVDAQLTLIKDTKHESRPAKPRRALV